MQFFLCVGFLLEYTVGPYTSYFTLALVSLATPILCFATFMWMPESPYALLGKSGKEDQALKSLRWLRGNPQETIVAKELNEIKVLRPDCLWSSSFGKNTYRFWLFFVL